MPLLLTGGSVMGFLPVGKELEDRGLGFQPPPLPWGSLLSRKWYGLRLSLPGASQDTEKDTAGKLGAGGGGERQTDCLGVHPHLYLGPFCK